MSGRLAFLPSYLAVLAIVVFLIVEALSPPITGLVEKSFIAYRELWLLVVGFSLLRYASSAPTR